jgi:hypothetical protein
MKLFFLLLFSSASPATWAAACCGGGFSVPSLITGDEKAQLSTSYGYSQITDEVGTDNYWRRRETNESSETLKIEASHIFADRFQSGVTVPVVRRSRSGEQSSGLGDVSGVMGYEYLPDWDYNPWRPRGHGYLQMTAPTGRSINEADATYQLDSRGRGFWAIGVGTVLSKAIGRWDVLSTIEGHRSFDKRYSNSQTSGTLKPGYGGSFGLGAGYNWRSLRFGAGLSWLYEDAVSMRGTVNAEGSPQRYTTATLSASYILPHEWTATLTYADQTQFGRPVNTTLGRGATLFLQKRWLR